MTESESSHYHLWAPGYQITLVLTSEPPTPDLCEKNKEQEQGSVCDNFWFCFLLLEMLCVALNDQTQKQVYFSFPD